MKLSVTLAWALLALCSAPPAGAQTNWTMSTEYPASNISGIGLFTFAGLVAAQSSGRLTIKPVFDAANGINSSGMVAAAQEGRIAGGDAFAGSLEAIDPVFGLPSLPFVVQSIEAARRLNDAARPLYRNALASKGMKLLYLTIWPPTGLWSDHELLTVTDIQGLIVRAYDKNSAEVMRSSGAQAVNLPFNDVMAKLKAHEINAVLSSGDGGAGRSLWNYLNHFIALNYATPISIAFVRKSDFAALPADLQKIVENSAAETQARQVDLLSDRIEQNYARMRANGVTIQTSVPTEIRAVLTEAGKSVVRNWEDRASPEARALLRNAPD